MEGATRYLPADRDGNGPLPFGRELSSAESYKTYKTRDKAFAWGLPEIFNSDQRARFTMERFTVVAIFAEFFVRGRHAAVALN